MTTYLAILAAALAINTAMLIFTGEPWMINVG